MSGREEGLLLLCVSSHAPHFPAETDPMDTPTPVPQATWAAPCVGPTTLSHFIALAFCLQPDVSQGNCWPLQGHQGQVVIRLPARVHLTGVTVQHTVGQEVFTSRTTSSAPRDMAVFVSLCWAFLVGMWPRGKAGQGRGLACFRASFGVCVLLSPEHCSAPAACFKGPRGFIPLKTCSGQAPEGS